MTSQKHRDAAERYIAANKSDPFCRARVMKDMRLGIAGQRSDNGEDAYYTADVIRIEARLTPTNEVYNVPIYGNMQRP